MRELIDLTSYKTAPLESCRLFHGRGHVYPEFAHVCIDWFAPIILITLYREESQDFINKLADELCILIPLCRSIQVQYRCREKAPVEVIYGEQLNETIAIEHQLKYQITLGKAQNHGLFLDMANGRKWVIEHAENKRVLNLFAYTCAFSVAALAGNASHVVNIDISKAPLSKGRDNHRLNEQDTSKVSFESVDIFKSYSRIRKHGPYDLLICDPPSFQKGSVDIKRDYGKILRRIPQFMNPNSDLMLCLNSPDLTEQFLLEQVASECPDCRYVTTIPAPEVFKESMLGKGLKVLIFKYLGSN